MKFLKFLKFLLTSTNEHGVHSPFVFEYLTKCLYKKRITHQSKTAEILLKSISYFDYQKFEIMDNEDIAELISKNNPECSFTELPFDLIYIEHLNSTFITELISENKIHNNSMVLVNDINRNKHTTKLWNEVIQEKKVTVAIDFHYCGALFFRREQVKEHFKIRI